MLFEMPQQYHVDQTSTMMLLAAGAPQICFLPFERCCLCNSLGTAAKHQAPVYGTPAKFNLLLMFCVVASLLVSIAAL